MKVLIQIMLINILFGVSCMGVGPYANPQQQASQKKTSSSAVAESELKSILMDVKSLRGNFQQKMLNDKGMVLQQSSGKMWLKKPGQFRWVIEGKDQRIVVGNGKKIWDYDIDLEQVTIQKMSKGQNAAPIFFLTGEIESLNRDFKISTIQTSQSSKQCLKASDQCFELKPKQQQSPFQVIRLGFKNRILHELELLDQLGQRSTFMFNQVELNQEIDPKQFTFTPPKGVDVVSD